MQNKKFCNKNLDFFVEFLLSTGMSKSDFAKKCNRTRQDISYYFRKDDILLSIITCFLEKMGYFLILSYYSPTETQRCSLVQMDLADGENTAVTKRRLFFLRKQMRREGLSIKEVTSRINVPSHFLKYAFKIDDLRISKIKQISEEFGWTLKIEIVKAGPQKISEVTDV